MNYVDEKNKRRIKARKEEAAVGGGEEGTLREVEQLLPEEPEHEGSETPSAAARRDGYGAKTRLFETFCKSVDGSHHQINLFPHKS